METQTQETVNEAVSNLSDHNTGAGWAGMSVLEATIPVSAPKRYLAIVFTPKDQNLELIGGRLKQISEVYQGAGNGNYVLINAFMPFDVVKAKRFSTEVTDMLQNLFPQQLNFYDIQADKPNRKAMTKSIVDHEAVVYVIGNVSHGVAEEVALFEAYGVKPCLLPLVPLDELKPFEAKDIPGFSDRTNFFGEEGGNQESTFVSFDAPFSQWLNALSRYASNKGVMIEMRYGPLVNKLYWAQKPVEEAYQLYVQGKFHQMSQEEPNNEPFHLDWVPYKVTAIDIAAYPDMQKQGIKEGDLIDIRMGFDTVSWRVPNTNVKPEQPADGIDHPDVKEWINHTVTQEDLDNNPTLVAEGIQVNEVIQIEKNDQTELLQSYRRQEGMVDQPMNLKVDGPSQDADSRGAASMNVEENGDLNLIAEIPNGDGGAHQPLGSSGAPAGLMVPGNTGAEPDKVVYDSEKKEPLPFNDETPKMWEGKPVDIANTRKDGDIANGQGVMGTDIFDKPALNVMATVEAATTGAIQPQEAPQTGAGDTNTSVTASGGQDGAANEATDAANAKEGKGADAKKKKGTGAAAKKD